MTLDQVKYLREQLNKPLSDDSSLPVANSVHYYLDNNIAFRNVGDFVIFDDENELIHCVSANRHQFIKNESPYAVMSSPYSYLQFTEANLTYEGLTALLDGMFAKLITDKQKEQIVSWMDNLPCKPINTVKSTYFKEEEPRIPNKPVTVITRPDGVHNGYPVMNKKDDDIIVVAPSDKAVETIKNMEEGDSIMVSGTQPITEMKLETNGVTITGKDLPMQQTSIAANDVTLSGMILTNKENSVKSDRILNITGDNVSIENSTIKDDGTGTNRTAVYSTGESLSFSDCVFDGNSKLYNGVEIGLDGYRGSAKKITSLSFKNCKFTKEFTTNNFVSAYSFVDGTNILFEDCEFESAKDSNPIRFSDETLAKDITVTIKNCKYQVEEDGEYDGMILFQNYPSTNENPFKGWTVNIVNLTNFAGKKYMENGTGKDRIWYLWDTESAPVVNFS